MSETLKQQESTNQRGPLGTLSHHYYYYYYYFKTTDIEALKEEAAQKTDGQDAYLSIISDLSDSPFIIQLFMH